jgi:hypothetical protein
MQVRKLTSEQKERMKKGREERQKELLAMEQKREEEKQKREEEREKEELKKSRLNQLMSTAGALYEEIDKLNKKAPSMGISALTLQRVNKVIKSIKEFMIDENDDFVDEIQEFFPAGDMPEYRDVVLVLSQLRAGLNRYELSHRDRWRNLGVS